jgi:hypothetical protein
VFTFFIVCGIIIVEDRDMKYNVKIKLNKNTIYEVEVEANNEVEAMEFAYDQMEMDTYAEPTMVKEAN